MVDSGMKYTAVALSWVFSFVASLLVYKWVNNDKHNAHADKEADVHEENIQEPDSSTV